MDNFAFPVPHGGNRVKGLCNGVVKNGPDRFRVDDGRFLREPVAAKGDNFAERSRLIIEKSLLGRIEGNFASFKGRIINTDFCGCRSNSVTVTNISTLPRWIVFFTAFRNLSSKAM